MGRVWVLPWMSAVRSTTTGGRSCRSRLNHGSLRRTVDVRERQPYTTLLCVILHDVHDGYDSCPAERDALASRPGQTPQRRLPKRLSVLQSAHQTLAAKLLLRALAMLMCCFVLQLRGILLHGGPKYDGASWLNERPREGRQRPQGRGIAGNVFVDAHGGILHQRRHAARPNSPVTPRYPSPLH